MFFCLAHKKKYRALLLAHCSAVGLADEKKKRGKDSAVLCIFGLMSAVGERFPSHLQPLLSSPPSPSPVSHIAKEPRARAGRAARQPEGWSANFALLKTRRRPAPISSPDPRGSGGGDGAPPPRDITKFWYRGGLVQRMGSSARSSRGRAQRQARGDGARQGGAQRAFLGRRQLRGGRS